MSNERLSAESALVGLKDFQRKTVDYVFSRLYGNNSTARFLIADEVGLGKTLVARGIIAKTLQHLQDRDGRVDVIYICSNATIAKQNVARLKVSGSQGFSISTRLTYLPKEVGSLKKNPINFISLTPGTAFDHNRSRGGHAEERAIIYRMLLGLRWSNNGTKKQRFKTGLLNMLQATAGIDGWRYRARNLKDDDLDYDLSVSFRRELQLQSDLYNDLKDCCWRFKRFRKHIPQVDSEFRYSIIGKLRSLLAMVCLSALKPDLVILDEFQRFKHLLDSDDEASMLATTLFDHPGVRVLLLSATPYKMFTLDQEVEEDDHYPDFLRTLGFLYNNSANVDAIRKLIADHRKALLSLGADSSYNSDKKGDLENSLLKVMCRTERVTTTRDHNSMLIEVERAAPLQPADLNHAAMVDKIAINIKAADPIEYWKSAPYLINFLKNYDLRRKLDKHLARPSEELLEILSSGTRHLLSKEEIDTYQQLDPANPRMRILFEDTIDKKMWQLLWMPPSMPYSEPKGVFAEKENLTKSLVFSSWNAVPDAIASLCSYEAERRMLEGATFAHSELYDKIKPLLRFARASNDNRLTGMPVLAWMLPSPTLATKIDPLSITMRIGKGEPVSLDVIRTEAKAICEKLVSRLPKGNHGSRSDKRWYWASLVLLEPYNTFLDWCKSESGWRADSLGHESGSNFQDHIDLLVQAAEGHLDLGPKPSNLVDVLCDYAIASPGVCSLRALHRVVDGINVANPILLSSAARMASGFRSLFNMPETIAMLRGKGEGSYWQLTLKYAMEGNIQSVLDEYVHVLKESLGLLNHSAEEQVEGISSCVQSVLSLRTSQLRIDEVYVSGKKIVLDKFDTRCRFALRFGDIRDDNNNALVRADSVRDAFNSPFRPFILASTSIGQEGLDFHTWCHAVMHWNLPSNPVDLEQREGRVHRYKGHAVRKNLAEKYGLKVLLGCDFTRDPWEFIFNVASELKREGQSDLIPYWIFEDGKARVERRIPLLPFSKEVVKLKKLKEGLALYRIVFGQPRQEDLIFNLSQNGNQVEKRIANWLISLEPPAIDISEK